jgi:hypothetical protein
MSDSKLTPEELKFRQDLKEIINSVRLVVPISESEKNTLIDAFMEFLDEKAESVEGLFNPDNEDGLKAVPLYWTRN